MDQTLVWVFIALFHLGNGCIFKRSPEGDEELSEEVTHSPNWKLLNDETCGQSYMQDRIVGGENATMGQYPWIARIGYKKDGGSLSFRCGGTVISHYYVVTAAHCVANMPDGMKVARVRLGDHNTDTNPDCEGDYCNDPYQDYWPIKIIEHECYNQPQFRHDIALIRVSRQIRFTEYVKPVCMLHDSLLKKKFVDTTAEVAGWGIVDIKTAAMTSMLQTLKKPVLENSVCVDMYRKIGEIGPEQMCVGGQPGKDSCGGDSGGPLVQVNDDGISGPRYYLIGVVSFGSKFCGSSKLPGIYTRITHYMPWILKNIKN